MQWEADFEALRRSNGATHPVTELTDEQIQALADWYYAGMLKWDGQARVQGLSEEDYAEDQRHSRGLVPSCGAGAGRHGPRWFPRSHHAEAARHDTAEVLPSYRKLSYALLKTAVRTNEAVGMRQQGKVVDTPRDPPSMLATRKDNGVGLGDVLDKWAAERSPRSTTRNEWSRIVCNFTKLNGKVPVDSIQKAHVIAYKDKLVEAKRAPGTIKKQLAALHALFEYAIHNDLSERNPAATVRIQAARSRAREHIPLEDLQRLFSSDVFTKGARPRGGRGEAAFWLPLLALFSGAGLEELGQVMVQDTKRTAEGIDYFEVTDRG
jgi:Phage integrase, N-terminal SAM-like domain